MTDDPACCFNIGVAAHTQRKMRYFLDTEFTDFVDSELISIAIVSDDGREFYAELTDFNEAACSGFVRKYVLPQLGTHPGHSMSRVQLRGELLAWLSQAPRKPKPVLCFDYQGDLDLVLSLLGGKLPPGWGHQNVSQKINLERADAYYAEHGGRHHALHDAKANLHAFM